MCLPKRVTGNNLVLLKALICGILSFHPDITSTRIPTITPYKINGMNLPMLRKMMQELRLGEKTAPSGSGRPP